MINKRLLELAKRLGNDELPKIEIPKIEPQRSLDGVVGELGKDYGLIFVNGVHGIYITPDGKEEKRLLEKKKFDSFYIKLFLDNQDLYYTQGNCLYKWPKELVKEFETKVSGITRYNGELVVALRDEGEIVDLERNVVFEGLNDPLEIKVFGGEFYHTEGTSGRGFVKTSTGQSIQSTGDWANGLTVLGDKLYFGGINKRLYSYDGKNVEEVCNLDFPIWGLHGVNDKRGDLIYGGGNSKRGIEVICLGRMRETILVEGVNGVDSIVSAPLDYIERLMKDGK